MPCSGVLTPGVPRPDTGEWALPPHPQPRTKDERSLRVWQTEGSAPIDWSINFPPSVEGETHRVEIRTMTGLANLFKGIPADLPQELFETLLATPGLRNRADRLPGPRLARGLLVRSGGARMGAAPGGGGAADARRGPADRPPAGWVRRHPRPQAASGRVDRPDPADDLAGDPSRGGIGTGRLTSRGSRPLRISPRSARPASPGARRSPRG